MDKRDDLHRLIRDCKKGLIDRIIVKSVSRFARNTQELLATIRFLKDIGVSVYFEEQGIDTDKLNSEMIV
ncbi:MAG: recombinase family protein [Clostridia bacterium]|nr:recombinase family protein [Clostridia bacterium]